MICPECGYHKVDWGRAWRADIAAGHNPAPKIFWCPKCEHSWRENENNYNEEDLGCCPGEC
jgi:DNA-directed RNA polymerase subunit M/transcription elongation factor TFIIS